MSERRAAASVPGPRIDIVMPVLDEVRLVGFAVQRALEHQVGTLFVVDGGSTDGTSAVVAALAKESDRIVFLSSTRGRGRQMNAGAALSDADVLLFLHCDATLPPGALDLVVESLAAADVVAGAFLLHTRPEGLPHWSHRLLWLADVRSRYTRCPYGDQAIFVRRSTFEALGGFPDVPILEDLQLSKALSREGRVARVNAAVEVSGRRFRDRPVATGLLMNLLPGLARIGVPPGVLARLYRPIR